MAELRVTQGLPQVREATTAVGISSEALQAPGRGLQKLGAGIQQTGQFFEEFQKRKQGAEDLAAGLNYQAEYIDALGTAKIEASRLPENEREAFVESAMGEWDSTRGTEILARASADSAVRTRGQAQVTTQRELIQFRAENEKARVQELQAGVQTSLEKLAEIPTKRTLELGLQAIDDAVAEGIIPNNKAVIKDVKDKFIKLHAQNDLNKRAINDPVGTEALIKSDMAGLSDHFPMFSAAELRSSLNFAQGVITERSAELANDIAVEGTDPNTSSKRKEELLERATTLNEMERLTDGHLINLRNILSGTAPESIDNADLEEILDIEDELEKLGLDRSMSPRERRKKALELQNRVGELKGGVPEIVYRDMVGRITGAKNGAGVYSDNSTAKFNFGIANERLSFDLSELKKDEGYYTSKRFFPEEDYDPENEDHRKRAFDAYMREKTYATRISRQNPEMTGDKIIEQTRGVVSAQGSANTKVGTSAIKTHGQKAREVTPPDPATLKKTGAETMLPSLLKKYPELEGEFFGRQVIGGEEKIIPQFKSAEFDTKKAVQAIEKKRGRKLTNEEVREIGTVFGLFIGKPEKVPEQKEIKPPKRRKTVTRKKGGQ